MTLCCCAADVAIQRPTTMLECMATVATKSLISADLGKQGKQFLQQSTSDGFQLFKQFNAVSSPAS